MNTENVKTALREINEAAVRDTGRGAAALLVEGTMTLTAFVKAIRRAKRGEYDSAVFYLMLWHSFKTSSNNSFMAHKLTGVIRGV